MIHPRKGRYGVKLLVFSDSHKMPLYMREAIQRHKDADAVLFCGDGEGDFEQMKMLFPEKAFSGVRGNCDWGGMLKDVEVLDLGGARIFMTHGHRYNVKMGLYTAVMAAREQKADILLFGHTHEALSDYDDGLYILNPGSISGYPFTYGVVDISEKGILVNIMRRN